MGDTMRGKWWTMLGITLGVLTVVILGLGFIHDSTVQVVGSILGVVWALLLGFALVMGYIQLSQAVGAAAERKGRTRSAWTLIAFFFGLIIPAIIVAAMAPIGQPALVMTTPVSTPTGRKCPFCAEEIRPEAIKCKHCGEMLSA